MREKSKTQTFTLFTKLSVYTGERWCLCVCICVTWYSCSPVMCADVVPEESQCNWAYVAFAVGVHVVCLQLLWTLESMWHVATCLCFVMFQSLFFFFLYNSFSSSSSTAAGISGGLDVIQPRQTKPNPALSLWRLGRRAGLLSRWLERPPRNHLRVFRPRWVMTSGQYVPLYPLPRRRAPD